LLKLGIGTLTLLSVTIKFHYASSIKYQFFFGFVSFSSSITVFYEHDSGEAGSCEGGSKLCQFSPSAKGLTGIGVCAVEMYTARGVSSLTLAPEVNVNVDVSGG
jgi:hypothetical protein